MFRLTGWRVVAARSLLVVAGGYADSPAGVRRTGNAFWRWTNLHRAAAILEPCSRHQPGAYRRHIENHIRADNTRLP
jgi:hypothetical protein